jgi:hypothetical protein
MKKRMMFLAMMMVSTLIFAQYKGDRSASPEIQAQKMKAALSLDDEQTGRIVEINKNFAASQAQLLADTARTKHDKAIERKRIQEEKNTQIRGVLTEEQFAQWTNIKKEKQDQRPMNKRQSAEKRRGGMTDQMDALKAELNLTDEQYKKMIAINQTMAGKMKAIRKDSTVARGDFRTEVEKLKEEKSASVKKILSKEQYEKFVAFERERMTQRRRGGPGTHDKQKKG